MSMKWRWIWWCLDSYDNEYNDAYDDAYDDEYDDEYDEFIWWCQLSWNADFDAWLFKLGNLWPSAAFYLVHNGPK